MFEKNIRKVILLSFVLGLLLAGCSTTKLATETKEHTITGLLEIGKFDPVATLCQAVNLNDKLEEEGEKQTFYIKMDGSFRFEMKAKKYVFLECTGRYYDKLKNDNLSDDTIKLTTLGNILASTHININLATSLTTDETIAAYKGGMVFLDAYKAVSQKLFTAANLKKPNKIPTDLDLTDPSLHLLTIWFLKTIELNPLKSKQEIFNEYKDSFTQKNILKLPKKYVMPLVPSIAKLGSTPKLGGLKINPSPTGIELNHVDFHMASNLLVNFNPTEDYILLSGKTGAKAIKLRKVDDEYMTTDVSSLFDSDKLTTFTLCIVNKSIVTCDGVAPPHSRSFSATGIPVPLIEDINGLAFINGIEINTTIAGIDLSKPVSFKLNKEAVINYDPARYKLLIQGKRGGVPLELTLDNHNHYSNPDIRNLFHSTGMTSFTLCAIKVSSTQCDTSNVQFFNASVTNLAPQNTP